MFVWTVGRETKFLHRHHPTRERTYIHTYRNTYIHLSIGNRSIAAYLPTYYLPAYLTNGTNEQAEIPSVFCPSIHSRQSNTSIHRYSLWDIVPYVVLFVCDKNIHCRVSSIEYRVCVCINRCPVLSISTLHREYEYYFVYCRGNKEGRSWFAIDTRSQLY